MQPYIFIHVNGNIQYSPFSAVTYDYHDMFLLLFDLNTQQYVLSTDFFKEMLRAETNEIAEIKKEKFKMIDSAQFLGLKK